MLLNWLNKWFGWPMASLLERVSKPVLCTEAHWAKQGDTVSFDFLVEDKLIKQVNVKIVAVTTDGQVLLGVAWG